MIPILFEKTGMHIRERGISLIELIMFIVIVSVALAGILLVMNVTEKSSADPLVHKQALAIAESLLEEVELMPFTYCNPSDANATIALSSSTPNPVGSTAGCNTSSEDTLPFGAKGENRYGPLYFDNVSNYNGFSMAGATMKDINGTVLVPLSGYTATVAVTQQGMAAAGTSPAIAAAEALLIKVTVTGPDNLPVVLEGIRTRYSPRSVP
jgi:MSHA pilin protein MshD